MVNFDNLLLFPDILILRLNLVMDKVYGSVRAAVIKCARDQMAQVVKDSEFGFNSSLA